MITIKNGDRIIYDPRNPHLQVVNPVLTLEDNAAGMLTFKIYEDNLNYDTIRKLFPIISVIRDRKTLFKGRVVLDKKDFYNGKSIEIEGKMAFFNDSYLEPFNFSGTPEELFRMIIENHNRQVAEWQRVKFGKVTVADPNNYIVRRNEGIQNSWEALKEKCFKSSLGGHVRIRYEEDGDYIDWLDDYTDISAQSIEFAKNLIDLSQEVDATETYTAIRPIGAEVEGQRIDISSVNDGKTYLINEEKAEEYGIIYAPEDESTWSDVTIPKNLLRKARDKLYNSFATLQETYEIRAVDLNLTDHKIEALNICEYVPVISKPHMIHSNYLLSKAEIHLAQPQNTIFYLGVTKRTLGDINTAISPVKAEIPKDISAFINDAQYITESQAENMLSGYVTDQTVESIIAEKIDSIPSGKNGLSAYEVAVENGYEGTIEAWTESLRGSRGDPGRAATIQIGTVITGAEGTNASVSNSGTENDAILDFVIPRGNSGGAGAGGGGMYSFEIHSDGHLYVITDGLEPVFEIDTNGHLLYRMEG